MRRLPVVQQVSAEDAEAAARPRWQWCLVGAGLAATIWLPLSVVAAPLGAWLAARILHIDAGRVAPGGAGLAAPVAAWLAVLSAAPLIVCFGVASGLAGALVGRFGGSAGPREAAVSGGLAAFLVTSVAALGGAGLSPLGLAVAALSLVAVGASAAFAGARFGTRRRSVLRSPR